MDVRIGIQNVARELVLETEQPRDEIAQAVEAAISGGTVLRLTDAKGGEVLVPGNGIGYVEFGTDKARPVGFAALG